MSPADPEIARLLATFPEPIAATAAQLVALLLELRPDFVARARFGWRSVNFRHPEAGHVCAVFPYPDRVALIFEHGRLLDSPLLEGETSRVRFIRFLPGAELPVDEIAILLAQAIALKA